MTVEVEIQEIKNMLGELSKKLDALIQDREAVALTIFSQESLKEFLAGEPDLYSPRDVKVAYR